MEVSQLESGHVINNGFYDIQITEKPHWNGTFNRWVVNGYRWIPSKKSWDSKCKPYGFREFKLVEGNHNA